MPLMSRGAVQHWRNYLIGENKPISDLNPKDMDDFCGHEIWDFPIAIFKGFGQTLVAKFLTGDTAEAALNTTYWSDKLSEPADGRRISC